MEYRADVKYLESHEWARQDDELFVCGISDYAQDSLSDVVYVELPAVGDTFQKGDIFGVVESVKAASDLYMPMGGEIVEINSALEDAPEVINEDPFGEGWMIKFKPSDPGEWDKLLDVDAYKEVVAKEAD
jgi:glycine cleavage system H protein